jgi:hypothetical protein
MKRNCRRALELMEQDLRGRVAPEEAAWLSQHLQECAGCRQAEAHQRAAESLLSAWPRVPHDPERAVAAIRATIERDRAGGTRRSWPRPVLIFAVALVVVGVALLAVPWGRSPAPPVPAPGTSRPAAVAAVPSRTGEVVRRAPAPTHSSEPRPQSASRGGLGGSRTARHAKPRSLRQAGQPAPRVAPAPAESGQGPTVASAELARFFAVGPPPESQPSGYIVETATDVAPDGTPVVVVTVIDLASAARVAQTIERAELTAMPDPQGPDSDVQPSGDLGGDAPLRSGQVGKGGWI